MSAEQNFPSMSAADLERILKLRQEAAGLNQTLHMHVVTLDKDGGATAELKLTPDVLNPLGMAHGGTIFSLCDIAAGSAAASHGVIAVTLDSTINFYRPGLPGTTLTANAYADDVKKALDSGMNAHVGKPFKIADLAKALDELQRDDDR